MVRADVADGIGRIDPEAEDVEVVLVAQTLEVDERPQGRHRRVARGLESCVARITRIDVGDRKLAFTLRVLPERQVVDPRLGRRIAAGGETSNAAEVDDLRLGCGGSARRCGERSGENDAEDDEQARSPSLSLIHVPS